MTYPFDTTMVLCLECKTHMMSPDHEKCIRCRDRESKARIARAMRKKRTPPYPSSRTMGKEGAGGDA